MIQGENLFLTYKDGSSTLDAVHDVSMAVDDHQFRRLSGGADRCCCRQRKPHRYYYVSSHP